MSWFPHVLADDAWLIELRNLFPKPGPESDTEKLDIKLDRTMGGEKKAGNSVHPNDSAFGFYIMSGTLIEQSCCGFTLIHFRP